LNRLYDDRFILGLGVSHIPMVEGRRRQTYIGPLTKMRDYVEGIANAGLERSFRRDDRAIVLAALGPKMLELARDQTKGALPYNVTPEHTAMAHEILGPDAWLCVEQKICLTTDAGAARAVAAQQLERYMPLPNYRNNWLRLGFSEDDLSGRGSDRFLDAMVAWGSESEVRARIDAHFDAGATHVCLQPFRPDGGAEPDWDALQVYAPGAA
jgi:probable F420-dependent oxidoreductase